MPGYAGDLRSLGKLRRSKANVEKVAAFIEDMRGTWDEASDACDAVNSADDALEILKGADEDNPFLPWLPEVKEGLGKILLLAFNDDVGEMVAEAENALEDFEEAREDEDASAEARDEAWGALLDSLLTIADVLEPAEPRTEE
jgi:hypothetical protein